MKLHKEDNNNNNNNNNKRMFTGRDGHRENSNNGMLFVNGHHCHHTC